MARRNNAGRKLYKINTIDPLKAPMLNAFYVFAPLLYTVANTIGLGNIESKRTSISEADVATFGSFLFAVGQDAAFVIYRSLLFNYKRHAMINKQHGSKKFMYRAFIIPAFVFAGSMVIFAHICSLFPVSMLLSLLPMSYFIGCVFGCFAAHLCLLEANCGKSKDLKRAVLTRCLVIFANTIFFIYHYYRIQKVELTLAFCFIYTFIVYLCMCLFGFAFYHDRCSIVDIVVGCDNAIVRFLFYHCFNLLSFVAQWCNRLLDGFDIILSHFMPM